MRDYPTNKISYNHLDEIWSIDLGDFLVYKTTINKGFRCMFVIKENISKLLWAMPLNIKGIQTITQEFSSILTKSKRKPLIIESDRGGEWYISFFSTSGKVKKIHQFSRFTDKGPSVVKWVIRTERNFSKKPVFEKRNADWLCELTSVIKQYNNTIHNSTKRKSIDASKKVKD